ncbi:DUF378 domain-containing protein [Massilia sp. RP-1-19]|uniref:DUF378 domain-containing protein n=1 Tax=Massilia polaris TaxID=2728846 RepID=A0A848HIX8_9BURK|nr:DUF378 domain-containing protein [Massilia polaris]NML59971.1 DUF378 domain-containing protein [Massilia polaris]
MATMNAPGMERRHIPERRSTATAERGTYLNALDWAATVLMIVGGLNWGLVGAFDYNVVAALFGSDSPLTRLVYAFVGIAALYGAYMAARTAVARPLPPGME